MSTEIREVTIAQAGMLELDRIVPLFDQYRMFYDRPSDPDLARRFLQDRIQHRDSVIFMALDADAPDETVFGFALLYPSFDSIEATPIWTLNDLYVREEFRRQGVARMLIERGRRLAENTGARIVSLSTGRDNYPSRQLYEKLGFELDDEFCTYHLRLD